MMIQIPIIVRRWIKGDPMKLGSVFRAAALLALATITQASAQTKPQWLTPGVYSATYTCPKDQRPVPVDFFVFDRNIVVEDPHGRGSSDRQVVRVDVEGAQFVASIYVGDDIQLGVLIREKAPAAGWGSIPYQFLVKGELREMKGFAYVSPSGWPCPLRPRINPNAKTLEAMSFAPMPERKDNSTRRDGVPAAFQAFNPAPGAADAIAAAVRQAIIGDSDSWTVNRLDRTSIGSFNFFNSQSDPSVIYVWSLFSYRDINGAPNQGWATARLKETSVECIVWHDRSGEGVPPQVRCIPPRLSSSAQMAKLGAGRQRLGPMNVAPTCFADRERMEFRTRERVVVVDRRGSTETITDRYVVPVTETVYTCPSQSFELECIAKGLSDRLVESVAGSGSTRVNKIDLIKDRSTDVSATGIADYNARIKNGTCVRVR
jgi:hypothetical protein